MHLLTTIVLVLSSVVCLYGQNALAGVGLRYDKKDFQIAEYQVLDKWRLPKVELRNSSCLVVKPTHLFQHKPFFCQIEAQIERKSPLAPRFRLGSLDYVNWLEGKTYTRW